MIKKLIEEDIFNKLSLDFVKSITFVGYEKKTLSKINSIDVVVVIDELSREKYNMLVFSLIEYNTITAFCPIKQGTKGKAPLVHLMIFDIKSYKEYCRDSPFMVYDWQRSKRFYKQPMTDFGIVTHLQPNYFFNKRRGIKEYLDDYNKDRISYRDYDKNMKLIKKYKPMSSKDRVEFAYYIMENTAQNFCKMYHQKNKEFRFEEYLAIFPLHQSVYRDMYKTLKEIKWSKTYYSLKINIESFIKDFKEQFDEMFGKANKVIFIRNAKTKMSKSNLFLGQNIDVDILPIKKIPKIDFKKAYCSISLRSTNTIKHFTKEFYFYKELNEIDYGLVDGKDYDYLVRHYPKIINTCKQGADPKFPKGENYRGVLKRLNLFLKVINDDSLVCTHNCVLRVLISKLSDIPIGKSYLLDIPHLEPIEVFQVEDRFLLNIGGDTLDRILCEFRV